MSAVQGVGRPAWRSHAAVTARRSIEAVGTRRTVRRARYVRGVDDDERDRLEHRLQLLDALCAAQDRRTEVMAEVAASQDVDEAVARIARLLDLTDEQAANAVLDRQVRSFTVQERERVEAVRAEVRAQLEAQ